MKSLQRIITEKLFESNKQRMDEASFEVGGKRYVCAFGRYSCDGEQISREDYFKAKEKSGSSAPAQKSKEAPKKEAPSTPQKDPSDKSDLGYGMTLEDMEDRMTHLKRVIQDANRYARSGIMHGQKERRQEGLDARSELASLQTAAKYARKGVSVDKAIVKLKRNLDKANRDFEKFKVEQEEFKNSDRTKTYFDLIGSSDYKALKKFKEDNPTIYDDMKKYLNNGSSYTDRIDKISFDLNALTSFNNKS